MLGLLGGCQLVNFAVSGLDVGGLWGWDVRSVELRFEISNY
ncbi:MULTISPECIES: hypothetical protein [unclassified Microcoleus]|nr:MULTISPECIES: hypothetical protein [unclassified Microcoleus]